MRSLFFTLLCGFLISGCEQPPKQTGVQISQNESKKNVMNSVSWQGLDYEYSLVEVDTKKLSLVLNLPEKRKTREVMRNNECKILINGGFYGKDDKPIGLMVTDAKVSSQKTASSLLNGFVSMERDGEIMIGTDTVENPEIAVQSGPLLMIGGEMLPLKIKNDAARRRMVAILTSEKKLMFMSVIEPKSRLTGPRLENLPAIVEMIGKDKGYKFESAINLDGGSASAYYDGEVYIEEANPVGSYLCVKP